jgi:hypothetical protein
MGRLIPEQAGPGLQPGCERPAEPQLRPGLVQHLLAVLGEHNRAAAAQPIQQW